MVSLCFRQVPSGFFLICVCVCGGGGGGGELYQQSAGISGTKQVNRRRMFKVFILFGAWKSE